MRVALVHDDLVQWGGAERVLEGLCEIYPEAPIFTSVFDKDNRELEKRFSKRKIYTSFIQKIPLWKTLYKFLLPLYPIAFEQFCFDEFDLVISHTTRFAKAVITKPQTTHICYCHTPPRFLWHFSGEKNYGLMEYLMTNLRIYDQVSANRVDYFIAGSKNAQRRIRKIYRLDSEIVYPFVDMERFKGIEIFDGGYFLVISRPNKYKRAKLAESACEKVGVPLRIIQGQFDDDMVVRILAGCKALIIPGIEDFGITSIEAQALGKPVVAFRDGGTLETVIEGQTGWFFDEQTVESLANALKEFTKLDRQIKARLCRNNAEKFNKEIFVRNFKQIVASLLYT